MRPILIAVLSLKLSLAMSATISVQAEKFGGNDTQPMGLVRGMPTNGGSFYKKEKELLGNEYLQDATRDGRSHPRDTLWTCKQDQRQNLHDGFSKAISTAFVQITLLRQEQY